MKGLKLKYGILLLLFSLLNFLAMRSYVPVPEIEKESDILSIISQREATQDAIRLLHYIYSSPKLDALSVDNHNSDVKYFIKPFIGNPYKDKIELRNRLDKSFCPYLHPNSIKYYIYALGKIVV